MCMQQFIHHRMPYSTDVRITRNECFSTYMTALKLLLNGEHLQSSPKGHTVRALMVPSKPQAKQSNSRLHPCSILDNRAILSHCDYLASPIPPRYETYREIATCTVDNDLFCQRNDKTTQEQFKKHGMRKSLKRKECSS